MLQRSSCVLFFIFPPAAFFSSPPSLSGRGKGLFLFFRILKSLGEACAHDRSPTEPLPHTWCQIRELCEAGAVSVRPRTDSGREALFRFGCEAAVQAAAEARTLLINGAAPAAYVTSLSRALGMGERKALDIATGAVAARAR